MNTSHPTRSGGRLLKRCVAALLMVTLQVQAWAQVTSPLIRNSNGSVQSGFAQDGTLVLAGQVSGNPHQLLHDLQNPTLWTAGAVSFSDSTNPTFVQPTIDQMMQAIEPPGDAGGLFMSRLYLNPKNPYGSGGVLSAPPSLTPELGSSEPAAGPLMDNRTHYERALAHAKANQGDRAADMTRWSTTDAGAGNGVAYLAKTHVNSSAAVRETLFDMAPRHPVFQASQTPTAGASAFFVIQGAQAQTHLANIQLHNARMLGSRVYFGEQSLRTSPHSGAAFDAQLGKISASTTLGFIQTNGQAHTFDWQNDPQFDQGNLGQSLRKATVRHEARTINLSGISDHALFAQGYNLFSSGLSDQEVQALERLQAGQLSVGSAAYNQARALAEARFKDAHVRAVDQSLEPPKKTSSWKKLVSIVVVAVVAFYTAGAVSAWAGQMLGATLTTSGAVATTVTTAGVTSVSVAGVAATAIGSAAASMASAAIGTAVQTGSVNQGVKAAGDSLKGGLAQVAVSTALAASGISGTGIGETMGVSEKVGNAIYNTVSNAVTNTLVNGGDFGQHLTESAINSTINMAAQNISDQVVASTEAGGWDRYAAHAALGCGVGMVRSGSGTGCEDGAYDGVASLMIDEVKRAQTADKKIMLKRCSPNGVCDEPVPVKSQDVVVSADGKVYVHNHGILNDENAALGGAREMNSEQANTQGVYVVINPHTGNALTEFIYAGYDKLNEVLGGIMPVSNATLATVDIRNRAAELGASVDSTAHSRGTLTEALATQYQLRNGQENLNISSQFFYGGAANAQRAADNLSKATGGQGRLYQSTHTIDPVGTLIGGNEPTGGVPWSNPIEAHVQYGPNPNKPEDQLSIWGETNVDAVLVVPSNSPSTVQISPQEVTP